MNSGSILGALGGYMETTAKPLDQEGWRDRERGERRDGKQERQTDRER